MKKNAWKNGICCVLAMAATLSLSACEPKQQTGSTAAPGEQQQGTASQTVDGIKIEDVKEGSGQPVKADDTVSVHYVGTLVENGKKFDSSYDRNEPFTFQLGSGQVIEGWEKGLVGMKPGGKRVLIIPPDKAYGKDGSPPVIPPNAALKFEVELVEVQAAGGH